MEKNLPMRWCSQCQQDVRDDGKGSLRPSANGGKRWQCSVCAKREKPPRTVPEAPALRKPLSKPGRKPKPHYDEVVESAHEIREFINKCLGI